MQLKNGRQLVIQTDALGRVHMREILRLNGCDRKTLAAKIGRGEFPAPANAATRIRVTRSLWAYDAVIAWVAVQPGL